MLGGLQSSAGMLLSSGIRWRNSCHGSCDCTQSASWESDIVAGGGELDGGGVLGLCSGQ